MENDRWLVIFFAGAPMWQYGPLIKSLPSPDGQRIPALRCSAVSLASNAFVELTVAAEGTAPAQILLVRQDHVMCAIQTPSSTAVGFAAAQASSSGYMEPTASGSPSHAQP